MRDSPTFCGTATLTRGGGEGENREKLKILGWLNSFVTDCSTAVAGKYSAFFSKLISTRFVSAVYQSKPLSRVSFSSRRNGLFQELWETNQADRMDKIDLGVLLVDLFPLPASVV